MYPLKTCAALGPTDVAWLLAAWNTASSIFPPFSPLIHWLIFLLYLFSFIYTFLHSVLLISVYKIYLCPPFLDSSWHCWCCYILQNKKQLYIMCVLCIQYLQIPPYQCLKGHMMVWKFPEYFCSNRSMWQLKKRPGEWSRGRRGRQWRKRGKNVENCIANGIMLSI